MVTGPISLTSSRVCNVLNAFLSILCRPQSNAGLSVGQNLDNAIENPHVVYENMTVNVIYAISVWTCQFIPE